jgi:hypothetical protein
MTLESITVVYPPQPVIVVIVGVILVEVVMVVVVLAVIRLSGL